MMSIDGRQSAGHDPRGWDEVLETRKGCLERSLGRSLTQMTGRVAGKVVIISGAARGQGASHARLLAREGAYVVIGDIREQEGKEVVQQINAEGGGATCHHLDVTEPEHWKALVASTLKRQGKRAQDYFAYVASKAAVIGMTKSAARTYGRDDIRVNAVAPGVIDTAMLQQEMSDLGPQGIEALLADEPISRPGKPEDVA